MKLIKQKSNGAVIFAGDDISLHETGARGPSWSSRVVTTASATIENYVWELPEGFIGNCWSYSGGAWAILAGSEQQVADKIAEDLATVEGKAEKIAAGARKDAAIRQIKTSGPPAHSIPALIDRIALLETAMGLR